MRRRNIPKTQLMIEQVALLFASFVWTTVILAIIIFAWAARDVQAHWESVAAAQVIELTQVAQVAQTVQVQPTTNLEVAVYVITTNTPTPQLLPPPISNVVSPPTNIPAPSILPDTPNLDDPTPIPIIVHNEEDLAEFVSPTPTPTPTHTLTPSPTSTATPSPTNTAIPEPTLTVTMEVLLEFPTNTPIPTNTPTDTPIPPTATPEPTHTPSVIAQSQNAAPSRLVIPSVNIDSQIVDVGWEVVEQNGQQYSIWQVADYAVGWHKTTAKPGQVGNMVMAGHHNVKGEVFRNLVDVEVGDEIVVYVNNTPHTYIVELKTIVKEKGESLSVRQKNAQWIAPTTDERLTMVTCWPYTNNTHRVIVVAKPE